MQSDEMSTVSTKRNKAVLEVTGMWKKNLLEGTNLLTQRAEKAEDRYRKAKRDLKDMQNLAKTNAELQVDYDTLKLNFNALEEENGRLKLNVSALEEENGKLKSLSDDVAKEAMRTLTEELTREAGTFSEQLRGGDKKEEGPKARAGHEQAVATDPAVAADPAKPTHPAVANPAAQPNSDTVQGYMAKVFKFVAKKNINKGDQKKGDTKRAKLTAP